MSESVTRLVHQRYEAAHLYLLLTGLMRDALNVDGGRHFVTVRGLLGILNRVCTMGARDSNFEDWKGYVDLYALDLAWFPRESKSS